MSAEPATFLFADIAGFTALTEAHGDEQAVELVAHFSATLRDELDANGGVHVKTIGDAVMLRIPDPADAIRFGLHIVDGVLREHGAPVARVGLHHGPAIERDGDYFGATVNLAARVSAVAAGGEVLVTGQTAALAPELEGVLYESRGRHELKNVREPVELFAALHLERERKLPIDPVCRMAVDPRRAAGRLVHGDTTYFLCSLSCAATFAQHPERFT